MSKPTNKRKVASSLIAIPAAKPAHKFAAAAIARKVDSESKQSRVIALLQSPKGATIAAMMKAMGWQQHSVRGFLAGVVRKRLKLKLDSKKVDGDRIYRIAREVEGKSGSGQPKRRSH